MGKQRTGETKPLAIRIEEDTAVLLRTGELVPLADVLKVQSGAEVIVVGKKNKRMSSRRSACCYRAYNTGTETRKIAGNLEISCSYSSR
jgi:hypothetical protein